jgi:BioD-like phosphotransacetylase family protein
VRKKKYFFDIVSAFKKISKGKEIMLVEGPLSLSTGSFVNCSVPRIAVNIGAKILLVERYKDDFIVDRVLQTQDYCEKWGISLFGVIINRIPQDKIERVKKIIKPILETNNIKILGLIPEDEILDSLTVRELYEVIGGKILAGKKGMNGIVKNILIGAMTPESASRYFRKTKNEIIITGGDRTDIIFAALEAGAAGLVLTGNLYPSIRVFPRADELGVPIILVPYDTYTTLKLIQGIVGKIKSTDKKRIKIAKKLIKENVKCEEIIQ